MSDTLYTATSGMILDMKRQEVIARNLAAVNIPGFKREYVLSQEFKNALSTELQDDLNGTTPGEVRVDFTQGNLRNTSRPLDFAIEGDGFFEMTTNDNRTLYTRNGAFFVSSDGKLVTSEGYPVSGESGEIQFSTDDNLATLQVTGDGLLRVRQGADANYMMKEIGKIKISDVGDKNKLVRLSANYFSVADGNMGQIKPQEPEKFKLMNNFLESANSEPVHDMVAMIECQRQFETGQKLLKMLMDQGSAERAAYGA
ncbi:MAG: hypothetical protein A2020_04420 [Lentisphaerae bacterium GWF2_45_14]|nr:MAG: hypothetical protein A2020_04420 [Lentisphaerae bacterium GWF2_45_14]